MNRTLSPQHVRLAALLGLLAVGVLAWWMLVARQRAESAAPAVAAPAHTRSATPATPTRRTKPAHAVARPHAAVKHHATAKPDTVAKPHTVAKSHTVAKPHSPVKTHPVKIARHGLPLSVATALTRHAVVVVSLSIPGAALDRLALRESAAGAKAAHAGFVALNVTSQREGGPLLRKLGVIDPPAVLVVRRRGSSVFAKLHGFVDRDTVEQAVADALR